MQVQGVQSKRFIISDVRVVGTWDWRKPQRCIVCNLKIKEGENIVYCPFCGLPSHRDHLLEWLKIKGFCPNCGKPLNIKDVKKW
ncbi:MAG: RING finger protein [Candidatus Freyarchaeota archaeon]